jgi:hypothetical protein
MALSDQELDSRKKSSTTPKPALNAKLLETFESDIFNGNTISKPEPKTNVVDPFVAFSAPKPATTTPNFDFFDAFNDNFAKNQTKASNQDIFSAFGDDFSSTKITTSKNASSAFDADFGSDMFADFDKMDIKNNNDTFDAFGGDIFGAPKPAISRLVGQLVLLYKHNNRSILPFRPNPSPGPLQLLKSSPLPQKNKIRNENTPSPVQKFSADYSKGECFDDDLAKVLQRSMVEQ